MKFLVLFILTLFSFSSFAEDYKCTPAKNETVNLGLVTIEGDPVLNIFESINISGQSQRLEQSTLNNVYLYLFDAKSHKPTYALEMINPADSYESFEMSVYGPEHIVLGSLRISRYKCIKL